MSIFQLYLLTRLSSINSFFTIVTFLLGVGSFVGAGLTQGAFEFGDSNRDKYLFYLKRILLGFFISGFVAAMIPSDKDLAIILGGYWVTNSEEVNKLPDNVVRTMNNFLKKYNKEEKE